MRLHRTGPDIFWILNQTPSLLNIQSMSQDDHMLVDLNPPHITVIYIDYSYINEQGILWYLLNYTKQV